MIYMMILMILNDGIPNATWQLCKSSCLFHNKAFRRLNEQTGEGFLRKNIVAVSFFKTVIYINILNTYLFN